MFSGCAEPFRGCIAWIFRCHRPRYAPQANAHRTTEERQMNTHRHMMTATYPPHEQGELRPHNRTHIQNIHWLEQSGLLNLAHTTKSPPAGTIRPLRTFSYDKNPSGWIKTTADARLTRQNYPATGKNARATQPRATRATRAARVAFTATNTDRTSSTHR